MQKPLRSAIRITCFLIVLALVLVSVCHVLKPKNDDGIYDMELFYELPENSVEVLVLGSSHAYCGFNTGVLWREQGIPAYILAGSQQPMWNSYHCLVEALKYQKPSLVVLEGYMTYIDTPYRDDSMVIRNTFGMRWSRNKIEAIKASAPRDRWIDFLLSYTQYHTRYNDLTFRDILPYQDDVMYENWKGTTLKFNTEAKETPQVADVSERDPLEPRTEEYYRKILQLCTEKDVPLLVVCTPYATTPEKQMRFNTAADIAAEYGVPFVDCNVMYDEVGMDFATDMADDGHLNAPGAAKFTSWFGQYLADHYDIPDHRGDDAYETWEKDAEYIYKRLEQVE